MLKLFFLTLKNHSCGSSIIIVSWLRSLVKTIIHQLCVKN